MIFEILETEAELYTPGLYPPVDIFPILKYVPERWASWKSVCRNLRHKQLSFYTSLLDECRHRLSGGYHIGVDSFMDTVVKRQEELGLPDDMAAYESFFLVISTAQSINVMLTRLLGAMLMEGGSDTTPSFLQSFVMMLVAFPDAQHKLHEEMDSVVGSDRVPRPDDFDKLVYLQVRLHVLALRSMFMLFVRLHSEKLTECDLSSPLGSLMQLLRMRRYA
jgi:hypothetical protein